MKYLYDWYIALWSRIINYCGATYVNEIIKAQCKTNDIDTLISAVLNKLENELPDSEEVKSMRSKYKYLTKLSSKYDR